MKVIGIDLDGTLAYQTAWAGLANIGEPLPGAKQFLEALFKSGWTICIWSTRNRVYVKQWLENHNLAHLVSFINDSPYPCDDHKRSFDIYIGDEAMRFTGDYGPLLSTILQGDWGRHWGVDKFDRDVAESDRNPDIYYKGTGELYLDAFEGITERSWASLEEKPDCTVAFLTICSHAKPYNKSWIHSEVRKKIWQLGLLERVQYIHLSSAGVIPSGAEEGFPLLNQYDWNSADIRQDIVKTMLKERLEKNLKWWYENYGKSYEKIFVYLRPSGNTLQAVLASEIPATILNLTELASPEWSVCPDPDDCLADPINLSILENML